MTRNNNQVQTAIVGMSGSGKTVLVAGLAMKMSQMADKGVFLAPTGDNRKQTLRYVQENWRLLKNGQWPQSTPSGELVHLEWELTTEHNVATVRFADCAGQDVYKIFNSDTFNPNALPYDLRDLFTYLNSANILIFLVNMEDLLGKNDKESLNNALNIDQMIYVLRQRTDIPRKIAVILSQYDRYRAEVDNRYNGDILEYLRINIPLLHGEYIRNKNFTLIPVAVVNDTDLEYINNTVVKVPAPNFSSYNLDKLIKWVADGVDELTPQLKEVNKPQNYTLTASQPESFLIPEPYLAERAENFPAEEVPKVSFFQLIECVFWVFCHLIISAFSGFFHLIINAFFGVFHLIINAFFGVFHLIMCVFGGLFIGMLAGLGGGILLGIILTFFAMFFDVGEEILNWVPLFTCIPCVIWGCIAGITNGWNDFNSEE